MSDTLTDIEPDEVTADTMPPNADRNAKRRAQYAAKKGGEVKPRGPRKKSGQRDLTHEVQALLELLAGVWAIRDAECATVLDQQAHEIAAGLNAWAQRDPKVYAMLVKWLEGGGAGALAFAIWPLAAQVAGHHVVPAIERRREALAERQRLFDEQWTEPEPLIEEVREQTRPFIPPNIVQE